MGFIIRGSGVIGNNFDQRVCLAMSHSLWHCLHAWVHMHRWNHQNHRSELSAGQNRISITYTCRWEGRYSVKLTSCQETGAVRIVLVRHDLQRLLAAPFMVATLRGSYPQAWSICVIDITSWESCVRDSQNVCTVVSLSTPECCKVANFGLHLDSAWCEYDSESTMILVKLTGFAVDAEPVSLDYRMWLQYGTLKSTGGVPSQVIARRKLRWCWTGSPHIFLELLHRWLWVQLSWIIWDQRDL